MKQRKLILLVVGLLILTSFISYSAGQNSKDKVVEKTPKEEETKFLDEKTKSTLELIEKEIKRSYYKDIDDSTINEGILKGAVLSLNDPYSEYMNFAEYKKFMESTDGRYSGIGIVISPGDDGFITVVSPIKDSPAFKAGIKAGDKILKVNDKEFTSDTMNDAVSLMRGPEGEEVTISVLRTSKDKKETFEFKIKRENIKLNTVEGKLLENNIGYLSITEFDKPTYDDFVLEYDALLKQNIKGLVLDLRGNPGGLLDVCAKIADIFLDEGTIVYTQYKDGKQDYYYSDNQKEEIPLVVLVNGGTASASEIVSGAFKDRDRAKLVGTQTFGKGIVQRLFQLPEGQAVKLTISEYFTPNGNNIHKKGIEPDYVVELPEGTNGIGVDFMDEDKQLQKAIEVLKGEM